MNLRRKAPADSLYLLLDTLCNAFGGIILLAVLVVLLTSKEKSLSGATADSSDMMQRRLELAQSDLQKSLQLSATLQAKADDDKWKKQIALLSTRNNLQDELQSTRQTIVQSSKELENESATDPTTRLKFLNEQLADTQAKKLAAQNTLAASEESAKELKQRLDDLNKQVGALMDQLQHALRLPREHSSGKMVLYVIVRYGHVYFCRNANMTENEVDIKWTSTLSRKIAEPIRGLGVDPALDADGIKAFLKNESKDSIYLVFCVFEDSFHAFILAKQITVNAGFAYGWEPFRFEDGPVAFGFSGFTPQAQ